jgi:hypothetical protein
MSVLEWELVRAKRKPHPSTTLPTFNVPTFNVPTFNP